MQSTISQEDTPSSPRGACHPFEKGNFLNLAFSTNSYKDIPKNFKLLSRAKELRKAGYLHEVVLWKKLKGMQTHGLDFHRQQVIGNYIVDFVCYEIGLIIEADGASHKGKEEYDENRDNYLKNMGFNILHIPVKEILQNIYNVVEEIKINIEVLLKKSAAK
jgi:very-short-patch-repair endonuclease